jgi:FkbM family methyltransferase
MRKKDPIRSIIRQTLSKNQYRRAASFVDAYYVVKKEGVLRYLELKNKNKEIGLQSICLNCVEYPIYFRPGTKDLHTIIQNIIREEYGAFRPYLDPTYIIDAGGFIGDVSIYFLNRFKKCRIVTLEPNKKNFIIAKKNLSKYGDRVLLLNKGLWNKKAKFKVIGSSVGSSIVECKKREPFDFESICVSEILKSYNYPTLDILKLDIEGAEKPLFEQNYDSWLFKTKMIIVEFHDEVVKKEATLFLERSGFHLYCWRSLVYCFNKHMQT